MCIVIFLPLGYRHYREACQTGSGRTSSFADLEDTIPAADVDRLKAMYTDVEDIDLFVGGILETSGHDSIVGPTFRCIIVDTFAR